HLWLVRPDRSVAAARAGDQPGAGRWRRRAGNVVAGAHGGRGRRGRGDGEHDGGGGGAGGGKRGRGGRGGVSVVGGGAGGGGRWGVMVKPTTRVSPRPEMVEAYLGLRPRFSRLYAVLRRERDQL